VCCHGVHPSYMCLLGRHWGPEPGSRLHVQLARATCAWCYHFHVTYVWHQVEAASACHHGSSCSFTTHGMSEHTGAASVSKAFQVWHVLIEKLVHSPELFYQTLPPAPASPKARPSPCLLHTKSVASKSMNTQMDHSALIHVSWVGWGCE